MNRNPENLPPASHSTVARQQPAVPGRALPAIRGSDQRPRVALLSLSLALTLLAACNRSTAPGPGSPATKASLVRVLVKADSVSVETPAARFVLFPNGYLQASLVREGSLLSLDTPSKEASDFSLDLASTKVTEAAGKLGSLGKRIEITGKSPLTGLAETLALEI